MAPFLQQLAGQALPSDPTEPISPEEDALTDKDIVDLWHLFKSWTRRRIILRLTPA